MEYRCYVCSIIHRTFTGRNPMVATDAICFMPWIARQYGLKMPEFYKQKKSCNIPTGDRTDINKAVCR